MADNGFIGSVCVFGSTTFDLLDASYNEGGPDVEVSGSTSPNMKYVAGQSDVKLSLKVSGTLGILAKGDHGEVNFNWNDGDKTNIALAMISSIGKQGTKNERINNTIELVEYGGPA